MRRKTLEINKILPLVQKPARYINGEWNSVHKDLQKVDVKVALAYPDVYEIGASNLGLQIIYEILNEREDTAAERVYAPWNDLEEILRNRNIPLFTLESKSPVDSFDIFGFTLQYEMTFTNILNMLNLAGIPLYGSERDDSYPLIAGGGPCAFNPEPLALFFDFFVLGDGEEVIGEIIDCYKKNKTKNRQEILESLSQIEGVYVPSFYQVDYDSDGIIKKIDPLKKNTPFPVNKRIVSDLEKFDFPRHPIVPFVNIVHDRCSIEIMRGCTRGCRFCQAGMIYRPVRERSLEKVTEMAKNLIRETGYDEISFASLSSSDYSSIEKVFENLKVEQEKDKIAVSLPSLRVDAFSVELAKRVQKTRKTGLTFAPEAGTQRLRDVINKCVTEDDLYNSLRSAFEAGWRKIKLYFMIGLPTETTEDLKGIVDLCNNAVNLGLSIVPKKDRHQIKIKVSVSSFVPKAVTPFQWVKQDSLLALKEKQQYLQTNIRNCHISLNWHDAYLSLIEGVFARGDRRLAEVLKTAWESGCRFDGWSEYFNFDKWLKAFEENNLKIDFYTFRDRPFDEVLPWNHLSSGVNKEFLISEYEKSKGCKMTPDCRFDVCSDCGVCLNFGVENIWNV